MSQSIANLAIDLTANIAGFTSDLGRANREAEKFAKNLERDFGRIGARIGAALATGITAVSAAVRSTVNELDRLGDVSKQIAVSTEALSGLGYAAKLSGADAAALEKGLTKLSRTMAEAGAGGAKQAALFDAVGVSINDAEGKLRSADEVFLDLATRFRSYKDGAGEVALAQQLMGKSATALIPLLNEGRDGIKSLTDEAERLGVVVGGETVEQAQAFNDNMDRLKAAVQGAANELTAQLLPALVQVSTSSADATVQSNGFKSAADGLAVTLKGVATVVITLKNGIESLVDLLAASVDSVKVVGAVFEDIGKDLGAASAAQIAFIKGDWSQAMEILAARAEDTGDATNAALSRAGDGWSSFASGLSTNWGDIKSTFQAFWGSATKAGEAAKEVGDESKKAAASIGTLRAPLVNAASAGAAAKKELQELRKSLADLQREWDREVLAQEEAEQKAADATIAHARAVSELQREFQDERSVIISSGVARDRLIALLRAEEEVRRMNAEWMQRFNRELSPEEQAQIKRTIVLGEEANRVAREQAAIAEQFRSGWLDAYRDVLRGMDDLIASGLKDWSSFTRGLEQSAESSLRNISQLFQNTVMTPGGGGFQAFGQQLNQQSMFGQGGTGSTIGGWANAAGSAYAGWQAAGRGNRLATVANFTAAGATVGGPWGALIGAVVGLVVAFARTVRDPQIRLAGAQGRIQRQEGEFQTVFGQVRAGSAAGVKWEQYVDGIRSFDKSILDMVSSFRGAEPRLQAIRTALSRWSYEAENQAASLEEVLKSRFATILGTFDQSIQSFVMGGADLQEQMQRFGDALGAEAAFVAAGIDDIDFSQFLVIVDDMTMAGEETGAAVNRIVGGMGLLGAALDVMGVDLGMTGEAFVRFSTSITEAAGGLDQAQALWDRYFSSFFSAEELAQRSLGNVTSERDRQLAALGLDANVTPSAFRDLFEQLLPTLSAEAVVQWLQAADAIQDVIDAEGALNAAREQQSRNAQELAELLDGLRFENLLGGMSDLDRQIAQIQRDFDRYVEQARALGASEDELNEIRALGEERIRRLTEAQQEQNEVLDDYWANLQDYNEHIVAEQLDALRRAAAQVRDFLDGMALSATSSLSPEARLAAARAQFAELARLAATGDVDAIARLTQAAQQLLQEGRGVFGAGVEFTQLETFVRNILEPFAAQANASSLPNALNALTAVIDRLNAWLSGQGAPGSNLTIAAASAVAAPAGLAVATAGAAAGDGGAVVAELEYVGAKVDRLSERIDNAADQVSRALEQIAKQGGRGKSGWG